MSAPQHDWLGSQGFVRLLAGRWTRQLDPGRVETATLYELTDLGRSLELPLAYLREWVDASWQSVEAARQHWDHLRRASS
jgi:DNA-binding HxlR family transcriptional regulator